MDTLLPGLDPNHAYTQEQRLLLLVERRLRDIECHGHHEKPYGCDRDRAHLVVRMGAVMESFLVEDLELVEWVCSTRCGSDRASHGAGALRFRLVNAVTAKHVAEVVFNLAISPRCSRNPTRVRSVEAVSASELVSIGTAAAEHAH